MANRSPSADQARQIADLARETAMHAHSYVQAAVRASTNIAPSERVNLRMPLNFLLGHACELAMKSLLIAKGYEDGDLKEIGHHLDKGLAACKREGITILRDFEKYCEIMRPAHGEYLTRYAIRTFPWIGYDDAVEMIIPQLRLLPWPG